MEEFKSCKICNGEVTIENKKYNLGKCNQCNFVFCLSIFSQDDFVKVYQKLYNTDKTHYQRHSDIEFNNLIANKKIKIGLNREKLIKNNILNGKCKSVLEIGSGIGLIGCYLKSENATIGYKGIEIDKESYEKSQVFKLDTINGDFTLMKDLEETFDVIMLWEVIEHLQDLKMFLDLAYSKLNSGGKVILSTPNYNKIHNYPNRKKDQIFQDEPPIHLNFFTAENIVNIFKFRNFKTCTVKVKKYPYLELFKTRFYSSLFKSFFNKYNGSTLYFVATKGN